MATQYGSRIMTGLLNSSTRSLADAGEGGGRVRVWVETIEATAASAAEIFSLAIIPSNARILGMSTIYWDDLASVGAPTLDLGFTPLRSGDFTADDVALNDGLDLATAASSARVIKDIANYGKRAYEFINGQTTDPKCDLHLIGTLKDAATNATGTVTIELFYTVD